MFRLTAALFAILVLATPLSAQAPQPAATAFERFKAMEGEWIDVTGAFGKKGAVVAVYKVTGSGNKITGAILTEGVDIATAGSVGGNAEVHYSRCAIDRAVNGAAQPAPVSRGWAQIY